MHLESVGCDEAPFDIGISSRCKKTARIAQAGRLTSLQLLARHRVLPCLRKEPEDEEGSTWSAGRPCGCWVGAYSDGPPPPVKHRGRNDCCTWMLLYMDAADHRTWRTSNKSRYVSYCFTVYTTTVTLL